jgi:hypothetical protein
MRSGYRLRDRTVAGRLGISIHQSRRTTRSTPPTSDRPCCRNDDQWQRFCHAAALDTAASDPRFLTNAGRVQHGEALITSRR